MNIGVFETTEWEQQFFQKILPQEHFVFDSEPLSLVNIDKAQSCEVICVFIYSKITKEILDQLPHLKLITTRSTGFDHIDLDECKKRNIAVCNVPTYGENTVAEHTFALILALSRNVHKSYLRMQNNDFSIEGLKGFDLKNKTLGVIGTGHIGLHVIRIARGFGMKVLAYTRHPDSFMAEVMGFEYTSFETLLQNSDIISLHIPYNESTHHMINRENIHLIKHGAVLINTARGANVETEALIFALDNGILNGVGLDVIEGEEYIREEKQLLYDKSNEEAIRKITQNHTLFSKPNVVFTPHTAFYSQEALERILETTIRNIQMFRNKKIVNTVE